jgi:MscS family membrane protein
MFNDIKSWSNDLTMIESIGFGLVSTLTVYLLIYIFWRYIFVRAANKTQNRNDLEIVNFLSPFVHYVVILAGLYVTFQYSLDSYITAQKIISSTILIIVLIIVAITTNRAIDRNLPRVFATLDEKKDAGLARSASLISTVSKILVWLTVVLITLTQFDIEITAAVASLTVFSLVIGMALQESASNMIITGQLILDSPYDIGEKIEINGQVGIVTEIGVLSTKIKTPADKLMVIPNRVMASSTIINFARGGTIDNPSRVNLRIDVNVGYDESPEHVKNVIRDILSKNSEIMQDDKPLILLTDMLDSSLCFRINTYVDNYNNELVVRDQILTAIIRRFKEEGIEIPYPHLKVLKDNADVGNDSKKQARVDKAIVSETRFAKRLIEERHETQSEIDEKRKRLAQDNVTPDETTQLQSEILELESKLSIDED